MRSHKLWTFTDFFACLMLVISEGTRKAYAFLKKLNTRHNTRELQFASNIWISFHHNDTHTLSEKTKSVLNRNIQTDFAALKQCVHRSSEHPEIRKQQLAKPLWPILPRSEMPLSQQYVPGFLPQQDAGLPVCPDPVNLKIF